MLAPEELVEVLTLPQTSQYLVTPTRFEWVKGGPGEIITCGRVIHLQLPNYAMEAMAKNRFLTQERSLAPGAVREARLTGRPISAWGLAAELMRQPQGVAVVGTEVPEEMVEPEQPGQVQTVQQGWRETLQVFPVARWSTVPAAAAELILALAEQREVLVLALVELVARELEVPLLRTPAAVAVEVKLAVGLVEAVHPEWFLSPTQRLRLHPPGLRIKLHAVVPLHHSQLTPQELQEQ